ncbi:MAG: hypothetical protein QXI33_01880 [Candidatus Pacearchaeota archaeon]
MIGKKIFQELTPEIPKEGDLYICSGGSFSFVEPCIVSSVEDNGFFYRSRRFIGKHVYGLGMGILIKNYDNEIKIYADRPFLEYLERLERSK